MPSLVFTPPSPSDMTDLSNVVTTQIAAELLGYHANYVRQLIRQGKLESIRVGNMLFVTKDSIEEYKKKRLPPGRPSTNTNK